MIKKKKLSPEQQEAMDWLEEQKDILKVTLILIVTNRSFYSSCQGSYP